MSASLDIVTMAEGFLTTWRSGNRRLPEDVARSLHVALITTEIYFGDLQLKRARITAIEAKLARMWSATSMLASAKCMELAEACMLVAQYWANPPSDPTEPEGGFERLLMSLREVMDAERGKGKASSLNDAA